MVIFNSYVSLPEGSPIVFSLHSTISAGCPAVRKFRNDRNAGEAHWPDEALMSSLAEELAKQAE